MGSVGSVAAGLPDSQTVVTHRAQRAARDFEAMMLTFLLRPLESTMASVPGGGDHEHSVQDYAAMGTEALAGALTSGRGFGIASMILERLTKGTDPTVTKEGSLSD